MKKTPSQVIKDQAARLRKYLDKHGIVLSSTLALESVCRAVHDRPWNVVQALEPRQDKATLASAPVTAVYFEYRTTQGVKPLALIAHRWIAASQGVESVSINQALHQSTDSEILALFETPRQEPWLHLTGRRPAHPSEGEGALVLSGTEARDDFAIWIAAFRPHLLLSYLAYRYLAGPKELFQTLTGVHVEPLPGGEGGWQVSIPADTKSLTGMDLQALTQKGFPSRGDAEIALAKALLGGFKSSESKARWIREDLATLEVELGSGTAQEARAKTVVAGRHSKEDGAPLVLTEGPLSAAQLRVITDNGNHYVNIVTQVALSELYGGMDYFGDHLSELVTGSIVDLEDLSFKAAPTELNLPTPAYGSVWLQIVGGWVPMDQDADEDQDETSATA